MKTMYSCTKCWVPLKGLNELCLSQLRHFKIHWVLEASIFSAVPQSLSFQISSWIIHHLSMFDLAVATKNRLRSPRMNHPFGPEGATPPAMNEGSEVGPREWQQREIKGEFRYNTILLQRSTGVVHLLFFFTDLVFQHCGLCVFFWSQHDVVKPKTSMTAPLWDSTWPFLKAKSGP